MIVPEKSIRRISQIVIRVNNEKKTNEPYIFDFFPSQNNNWNFQIGLESKKNIDYYETLGTNNNSGRILHKATVVYGGHIFWKFYYEHPNNKGYLWKYYMNHNL